MHYDDPTVSTFFIYLFYLFPSLSFFLCVDYSFVPPSLPIRHLFVLPSHVYLLSTHPSFVLFSFLFSLLP